MEYNTTDTLNHWHKFNLLVLFESLLVGGVSGIIVVLFRLVINYAGEVRDIIYKNINYKSFIVIIGWFFILIIIGYLLGIMVQKVPNIKGSGIPQIKGFIIRQVNLEWEKELIRKFIGGILALGFGLSLGREGPSVQLGATTGLGISKLLKRHKIEEKYLVTAGASAGLAAAFNAPLAGVVFALEELHRNFSPLILTCVMSASIVSEMISSYFFGMEPVFNFSKMQKIPLRYYGLIIILSIIIAFLGKLFNILLLLSQDIYANAKIIKGRFQPIIPFVISGIIGLTFPIALGGGHELIVDLTEKNFLLCLLLIIFIIKLLFTAICYGSGLPGGIFLPILVLGALIGKAYGQLSIEYFGIDSAYSVNFIALGMAAYFTAVVRAPITGSILITEMTGSFNHLLSLIVVCMVAYVVTDLINSSAIYDVLLEKMLNRKKESNYLKHTDDMKILMEISVCFGSKIEHKRIKDIKWPEGCLIVGIKRSEKEIIPRGDYKIYAGDFLIILADNDNVSEVKPLLQHMASEPIIPD